MNLNVRIAMYFLGLAAPQAIAQVQDCARAVVVPAPRSAEEFRSAGLIQEAIWAYREEGLARAADELEAELIKRMERDRLGEVDSEFVNGSMELYPLKLSSGILGIFKPDDPDLAPETSYKNEVAASKLDRLFELNLVPITVTRTFRGRGGSLQYFASGLPNGWRMPTRFSPEAWFFDFLIAQDDGVVHRFVDKLDNVLVRSSTRQVLIDNASSFFGIWDEENDERNTRLSWNALITYPLRRMGLRLRDIAPSPELRGRIAAVTDDQIRATLRGLLPRPEIERVILRRARYLRAFP